MISQWSFRRAARAAILPTAAVLLIAAGDSPCASQSDDPREAASREIVALTGGPFDAAGAEAMALRIVAAESAIGRMAPPEQPPWRNLLAAAINVPRTRPSAADSQGARSDAAPAPEFPLPPEAAEYFYRALVNAANGRISPSIRAHVEMALADSLTRVAMDLKPDERDGKFDEPLSIVQGAAGTWKAQGESAWEVMALAEWSMTLFQAGRDEEAEPIRERAVVQFEALPEPFLELASVKLDEPAGRQVDAWLSEAAAGQAAVYLLEGLAKYNRALKEPHFDRESFFLFAESLRIGIANGDVTAINNVGALLIRPGIGEETGKASKVRSLRDGLSLLTGVDANPHWRGRPNLRDAEQTIFWLQARVGQYVGEFYAEAGQLLMARRQLQAAELAARRVDDKAMLPLVLESQARLLSRVGLSTAALDKARELLDSDPSPRQRADGLMLMAGVAQSDLAFDLAGDYLQWAQDLFIRPGSRVINRQDLPILANVLAAKADLSLARGEPVEAADTLGDASRFAAVQEPEQAFDLGLFRRELIRSLADSDRYRPSASLLAALREAPVAPVLTLAQRRGAGARVRITDWQSRVANSSPPSNNPQGLTPRQVDLLAAQFNSQKQELPDIDEEAGAQELFDDLSESDQNPRRKARVALDAEEWDEAARLSDEALEVAWTAAARDLDPAVGIESPLEDRLLHHRAAHAHIRVSQFSRALATLDMSRHRALAEAPLGGESLWAALSDAERIEATALDSARAEAAREAAELALVPRLADRLVKARQTWAAAEGAWQEFVSRVRAARRVAPPRRLPLSEDELSSLLEPGEALMAFSVGPTETLQLLVVRKGDEPRFTGRVIPIREGLLSALVESLRDGISDAGLPYEVVAREMSRLLYDPIAAELEGLSVVAILPDGPLNGLPMGVLIDSQGRFLTENTAFATCPSLAHLVELRRRSTEQRETATIVDLVNFDDRVWLPSAYTGNFNADALAQFLPQYRLAALPHTKREADRLASLFGRHTRRYSGTEAQEADVKRAPPARFIHLSTHGLVDPYNPFSSVLVLAQPIDNAGGDGFLEAREIMDSPAFSGAELVTLSTCESGLGLVQGTEGILGLTWSFLAAGNRSVVSSLWGVDDRATADLMEAFYREVLGGKSKAEALRQAALSVKSRPETAHPAFWAPFTVTGEWR